MIPWLGPEDAFPPVGRALREPNGLLAASTELSPRRLLDAYRQGIFPWYSAGDPVLWWSPDPRMVLHPSALRISRSLRRRLHRDGYEILLDSSFGAVVEGCAAPTPDRPGTWITPEMRSAYLALHRMGHAHSVETWIDGELAGGLYGVAIGRMFYGESMFSRVTDASKLALAHLCRYLEALGFGMIDCQMETPHLVSLGAGPIPRQRFLAAVAEFSSHGPAPGLWPRRGAQGLWLKPTEPR
ncbi:MAG: leucyl/phenylalanyl-tRNA--protein transferase [Betaproteobacteria bacterium]|nr:leucyl/phenylalanyl-tRNA--protein transferase [Betaproteobacteria bacterium]